MTSAAIPINNPPPHDGAANSNPQQPPPDMPTQSAPVATAAPAAAPTGPNTQDAASSSPPLAPRIEQLKGWWKNLQLKQKGQHQDNAQGTDSLAELEVIPLSQSQRAMSFFYEDVERPPKHSRLRRLLGKGQSEHHHHHHHHHQLPASAHASDNPHQQPRVSGVFSSSSTSLKHPDNEDHPAEHATETQNRGIFGVPLRESIPYANVAISLVDENGDSFIYGYVPIVVAKCGVFLKEKATGVEGIFRLSGSEKRIKELKTIFNSPDRYGKGLVWEGYTVHDAANVFRRYLNDLPEPVIPLELYEQFREPLKGATKKVVSDGDGPQFVEDFDLDDAIRKYQKLIMELPPLNRQLLLYILDLLAVFAAKADENRMNSQNLAAVFSPGIISHPSHAMAPEEYRLNQCVLIFLIENQDHFLIGMQGPPETSQASSTIQPPPDANVTSSAAPQPTEQNPTIPAVTPHTGGAVEMTTETPESAPKEAASMVNTGPAEMAPAPTEATPTAAANPDVESVAPAPLPVLDIPAANASETEPENPITPSAEEANGTANGPSKTVSMPSPRKKLQKPRPVGQNPSAHSSQASLTPKG